MSEVGVVNLNDPRLGRVRDSELHTQNGYNSPIGDTKRVLNVLCARGYQLWTTQNPDVWYAVKGEEQLAVLRQDWSGNDKWHLAGSTGDVSVTPEEVALCLRVNSDEKARFRKERPDLTDEHLRLYANWCDFRLNEEELNTGVLSTQRSRHHFACCMHFLDRSRFSEQEIVVGKELERKLAIPVCVKRV